MSTSRRASKERTRQKLVKATLRVLLRDGPAALTTGRIAESAGVAQPTFYVHFSGMEEALQEAAALVEERLLSRLKEERKGIQLGGPTDMIRHAFQASVDALVSEPRITELFLRHRRDVSSPLGKRFRHILDAARRDLLNDLTLIGLDDTIVPDPEIHVDLIVGMVLTIAEGILDKRITDRDKAIDGLVYMTTAGVEKAVAKMTGGA